MCLFEGSSLNRICSDHSAWVLCDGSKCQFYIPLFAINFLLLLSYLAGGMDAFRFLLAHFSVLYILLYQWVSPPRTRFFTLLSVIFFQLQGVLFYIQRRCLGALSVYVECQNILENNTHVLTGQQ